MISTLSRTLEGIRARRAAAEKEIHDLTEPQRRLAAIQEEEATIAQQLAAVEAERAQLTAELFDVNNILTEWEPWTGRIASARDVMNALESRGALGALAHSPVSQFDFNQMAVGLGAFLDRIALEQGKKTKLEKRLKELAK